MSSGTYLRGLVRLCGVLGAVARSGADGIYADDARRSSAGRAEPAPAAALGYRTRADSLAPRELGDAIRVVHLNDQLG
ncbi:MAG: hypothetical protein LC808_11620, partial [Actinobacteria bacterium]|nr:hypothetical protein [Actinomycetota bacterium]